MKRWTGLFITGREHPPRHHEPWSPTEDIKLEKLVRKHGARWHGMVKVAAGMGRTMSACQTRLGVLKAAKALARLLAATK